MWVDPSGLFRSPEESKTAWIDRLNPFAMGARAAIRSLAGGRRNARSKTEAGRRYEDAQRLARYMKAWGADFEDQARAQVGMGAVLSLTVMGETSDGKLALVWTVGSGATRQPGEVGSSLASDGSGGTGTAAPDSSSCDSGRWIPPNVYVRSEEHTQQEAEAYVCEVFRRADGNPLAAREVQRIRDLKRIKFSVTVQSLDLDDPSDSGGDVQCAGFVCYIHWAPDGGWLTGAKGVQSPALGLLEEFYHVTNAADEEQATQWVNQVAAWWGEAQRLRYGDGERVRVIGGPNSTVLLPVP